MDTYEDDGDQVVVRLRQAGRARGGATLYDPLGIYPREEAKRVAQAKAAEFGGLAHINDHGWHINVWVPLEPDERPRIERLRAVYHQSRTHSEAARDELRAAVLDLIAHGTTEAEAARLAGVTRMTIRSWLGKR